MEEYSIEWRLQQLRTKRFKAWDKQLSKMVPAEECAKDSFFELFLSDRSRFLILVSTYALDRDGVEIFDGDVLDFEGHPRAKHLNVNAHVEALSS